MLFVLTLASVPPMLVPKPTPQEIVQTPEIRPLPGRLDHIPVFNSNSPELVLGEGILLSTFPANDKTHPKAHLNYPLQGYFDVFVHHVAKETNPLELRTLHLGMILHNPSNKPVTVDILQAASYLSQPDAPFIELPSQTDNNDGKVHSGPGSRVMSDILREHRQNIFPDRIVIPPLSSKMLFDLPIPVKGLVPPLNGRSTYLRLYSKDRVYAASLAMFAPLDEAGKERKATLSEWSNLLAKGNLVTPRDRTPTPINVTNNIIYGRVAGISQGSQWQADLVDKPHLLNLTIPDRGKAIAWVLNSLPGGKLGTDQIQSAPMLARYPDTAYQAHGNYGVQYSLNLPLYNPSSETRTVTIALQTPIKQDKLIGGLRFLEPVPEQTFFRGTVKVSERDDRGDVKTRYLHLVQKRGQQGEALVKVSIPPRNRRSIEINFLYPPDATPPQVLTVETIE